MLYIARVMLFAWAFRLDSPKEMLEKHAWKQQVDADAVLAANVENATVERAAMSVALPLLVWGLLYLVHLFV